MSHWTVHTMKTASGLAPCIYDQSGACVAMRHPQGTQADWDNNARLIAAAPELLEALLGFDSWLKLAPENYQQHFSDRIIKARAAITKATVA